MPDLHIVTAEWVGWGSRTDTDARITKMKDGRTHLAHKAEHAVDLSSGAVVAVTLQAADLGDTTSLGETLQQAQANAALVNERGVEEVDVGAHRHAGGIAPARHGWRGRCPDDEPGQGTEPGREESHGLVEESELVRVDRLGGSHELGSLDRPEPSGALGSRRPEGGVLVVVGVVHGDGGHAGRRHGLVVGGRPDGRGGVPARSEDEEDEDRQGPAHRRAG